MAEAARFFPAVKERASCTLKKIFIFIYLLEGLMLKLKLKLQYFGHLM